MKVILGVTASIAAYKACELASLMVKKGWQVSTIMTEGACKFVSPLTFKALTGNPVFTQVFDSSRTYVYLAEDIQLILIAPATACFISKLAAGIVSDLLSLTVISSNAPVLICPAMNERMYRNQIIQENIQKLKRLGYEFLGPYRGWLSCGHEGEGRLADLEDILKKAEEMVK